VNETTFETGSTSRAWRGRLSGVVPGERRGDLVGAELCAGPGRSRRPAVERVQVRAGRPGEPRGAGWHRCILSVATQVRYTGLSERTVRTCLDRLEAAAIISRCDPEIVVARIKRADRGPKDGT
jgi:hypothetical protein